MRIYVASSWRNDTQPAVVAALRWAGHEVYDFKNPSEDNHGFHWSDVGMPTYDRATNGPVPLAEYREGIEHPIAVAGFKSDFDAMKWANACVLVLDCGRSAHLELGWFVGRGVPTCILFANQHEVVPELMYSMVDHFAGNIEEAVAWADGLHPLPVGRQAVTVEWDPDEHSDERTVAAITSRLGEALVRMIQRGRRIGSFKWARVTANGEKVFEDEWGFWK